MEPQSTESTSLNSLRVSILGNKGVLVFSVVGAILAISIFAIISYITSHSGKNNQAAYKVGTQAISLQDIVKDKVVSLDDNGELIINGQLRVNNSLVLTPQSAPTHPTIGQVYLDKTSGKINYYDGTQYAVLGVATPAQSPQVAVTSLQGLSGVVTLTAGNGIAISGTTIANTGVTAVGSSTGSIGVGIGLSMSGNTLTNTGLTSLGGASGQVGVGSGLSMVNNTLASTVSLSSLSSSIIVGSDGVGNFTVSEAGSGSSGTVALGPAVAQPDNSNNPAIFIDKTGTANLIQIKANGTDSFVVNKSGAITVGSIGYSQVSGAPATVVNSLGGSIGAINVGAGLAMVGNTLSSTGSGISAINGTTDQVTVNTVAGVATIGLPQNISISSSPTFANLSLATALAVGNGGTGAITPQLAINNLSGLTTNGDILYHDGTNSTRLARGSNGDCLLSNASTLVWGSCSGVGTTYFTLAGSSGTPQPINGGDTLTVEAGANVTSVAGATDKVTISVVNNPTFTGLVTANNGLTIGVGNLVVTSGTINTATISGGSLTGGSVSGGTLTGTAVNGVTTANILVNSGSYADPTWITSLAKSKVGLTNVENTALSTWGGSSNINTVGTISSGTWTGNVIAASYIAQNLTINSSGNVDWSALSNYPAACAAGNAITALGDTPTCAPFAAGGGGSGANLALSNLSSVAINTSLLPGTSTIDLGDRLTPFRDVFIGGTATNNFQITGTASGSRTITIPDSSGTVCLDNGNCAGAGSGVTGAGTARNIAMYTATGQNIGNSILSQDAGATTVTVAGIIAGNGSGLTTLNGSNVSSGTVADARLSTNVTVQGNSFNGASQLVQTTAGGLLPIISGANLTNLNASNISSGTVGVVVGGTGLTSYTTGDLLYASAANTLNKLTAVAAGSCLVSQGAGTAPAWGSCSGSGTTYFTLAGSSGTSQPINGGDTVTIEAGSNMSSVAGATDKVTLAVVSSPTFSGLVTASNGLTVGAGNLVVTSGTINTATISGGSLTGGTVSGGTLTGTDVNGVTTANILLNTGSYADPTWITSLAKSKVGLTNVENTALSTWAGSANINTLGTITGGTWTGNVISASYIAQNLTINSSGNVDWSALNNYPAACAAGSALSALGDSPTCSAFAAGSGSGNYVQIQGSTPGVAQTGNFNISGKGIAATLQATSGIIAPSLDTASAVALDIGSTSSQININQSTQINGNISFSTGANRTLGVQAQSVSNTAGNSLTIQSGSGNGTGSGGAINIQSGSGGVTSGAGGALSLQGGNATTSGLGGDIVITGGNAAGTDMAGGNISLNPGMKTGTGASGKVVIKPQSGNDSTSTFQIQTTAGAVGLNYDTVNQQLSLQNVGDANNPGPSLALTCSGTGWSGTGSPYTYNGSSGSDISCSGPAIAANTSYQVSYSYSGSMASHVECDPDFGCGGGSWTVADSGFTPAIGGVAPTGLDANVTSVVQKITTTGTGGFTLTPWGTNGAGNMTIIIQPIYAISSSLQVKDSVGTVALDVRANTTNIGIGLNSLSSSTFVAQNNTALGQNSLQSNTTGSNNSASGYQNLQSNTTGSNNVSTGYQGLLNNSSGSNNTGIGNQSLKVNTTGSNNTALGSGADVKSNNLSFATAIGSGSVVGGSNSLILGRANADSIGVNTIFPSSTFQVGNGTYEFGEVCQTTNNSPCYGAGYNNGGSATNIVTATYDSTPTFTTKMVGGTILYGDGSTATIVSITSASQLVVNVTKLMSVPQKYTIIYPGGLSVGSTGTLTSRVLNDTATALQIQNAAGFTGLSVDTTAGNKMANGNFEGGTLGWASDTGSTTLSQNCTTAYFNTCSLAISTPASANVGAKTSAISSSLVSNTKYIFSVYVKGSSAGNFALGFSNDGSTRQYCDGTGGNYTWNDVGSSVTAFTTSWVRYNCRFTTGTVSGGPFVFIDQTDSTARTIYIDGAVIAAGGLDAMEQWSDSNLTVNGNQTLNGSILINTFGSWNSTPFEIKRSGNSLAWFDGNGDLTLNSILKTRDGGSSNSNSLSVKSGDTAGSYNSGNVNIYTGSVSAGTRGSIYLGDTTASAQSVTVNANKTGYALTVNNASTATSAGAPGSSSDGILITLGTADASRTTGNYFTAFSDGSTVAGKIQGGTNAVAYTTSGADYAEYFKTDPGNLPKAGEIVMVNTVINQSVSRGVGSNKLLVGIVSTNPGFIGNSPVCNVNDNNCELNYSKYNALVAISGQVPAKVNTNNGPIAIGDPITASSVIGEGAKAVNEGYIVGYAQEALASGTGTIQVLVRPQYYAPSMQQELQATSLTVAGETKLQGNAQIAGNLNIEGKTTLASLVVTGDAVFTGDISVQNISVADITVNGHVITTGKTPLASVALGAGIEDVAHNIATPAVRIIGNDTSGTIEIIVGANTSLGDLAKITFSKAFVNAPSVNLTPIGPNSAKLQIYVDATTPTGFSLGTNVAPVSGKSYKYSYWTAQ